MPNQWTNDTEAAEACGLPLLQLRNLLERSVLAGQKTEHGWKVSSEVVKGVQEIMASSSVRREDAPRPDSRLSSPSISLGSIALALAKFTYDQVHLGDPVRIGCAIAATLVAALSTWSSLMLVAGYRAGDGPEQVLDSIERLLSDLEDIPRMLLGWALLLWLLLSLLLAALVLAGR